MGCGCNTAQAQNLLNLIDEKCLDDLTSGVWEDAVDLGKQAIAKGTERVQKFLACNFGLSTQAASKGAKLCFLNLAYCAITKRDPVVCGTELLTCLAGTLIGGGASAEDGKPNLQTVSRC